MILVALIFLILVDVNNLLSVNWWIYAIVVCAGVIRFIMYVETS